MKNILYLIITPKGNEIGMNTYHAAIIVFLLPKNSLNSMPVYLLLSQ